MRVGLAQPPLFDVRSTVELIARAEAAGFDSAWMADQTFHADPYVLLAVTAFRIPRLDLCIGLTNPFTRHPATTARAIASIAALTDRRVVLGLGVGNNRELLDPLGLLDRPVTGLAEAIPVVRELLAGGTVEWQGEVFTLRGVRLEIDGPFDVPLLVGGRGSRTLSVAGRLADGAVLSLAGLGRAWDTVAEAASEAGRDPGALRKVAWGQCVIDPTEDDLVRARRDLGHVIGRSPEAGLTMLGLDPDRIRRVKAGYEEKGPVGAAEHVTDEMLRTHMIIGDGESCAEQLAALAAAGVDEFALLVKEPSLEVRIGVVDAFANRVRPALEEACR
jgi:5,10-methylenetetrahydromethanopterin reductase